MLIYLAVAVLATLGLLSFSITLLNQTFLFIYLYIEYNLGYIYQATDYPPIAISRYLKNYWIELFYVMGKYYLLPLKWCDLSIINNRTSKTAILLIHGYCRNQSDWWWLRKQFNDNNCPIFTVNLEADFESIAELTRTSLPQKIADIQQQTNCTDIILVGHSMGGLVASYYNEFLDTTRMVRAIITIASPLHGSKVSVIGKGENAKQMLPQSKFLDALREKINNHPERYYQIATQLDNIVFPWRSTLLDGTPRSQQLVLPDAAHLSLLHSQEVAKQLNLWVKEILSK